MTRFDVASAIEHTLLTPTLVRADIERLVNEAELYKFFGICVPPFWVKLAKREIDRDPISLVTVVGFPLGYSLTQTKLDEIKRAIDHGADELDVVWNISSFKSGNPWTKIEIAQCAKEAHAQQKILKVIIETSYLSDEEIIEACRICVDSGVDFVKTSTGFAPEGAKVRHIKLMRKVLPDSVGIKASGGIKTFEQVTEFISAGSNRIGTSNGVKIVSEIPKL